MVKYSFSNSKMNKLARHFGYTLKQVPCFDLPAGWSCGKADICSSFADEKTGKLKRVGRILCYAAKGETFSPSARALRWNNYNKLLACGRDVSAILNLLVEAFPKKVKIVRYHSSGDFYCKEYFLAWMELAKLYPDVVFFGYTKYLEYATWSDKPSNFYVQYSWGSKDDGDWNPSIPTCYVRETNDQYPNIKVVCSSEELGWEDYPAIVKGETFVIDKH